MSLSAEKSPASMLSVHLALAGVSLIYGFFFVAVKLLLREIDETQVILLRLVLSALLVAGIEWGALRSRFASWQEAAKVLGLGLIGIFMVQNLVVMGVERTTAFHAALLMATIPLMTVLWSMMLRREAFSLQKLLGILLAFGGVLLLVSNKHAGAPLPDTYLAGDLIILLNSFLFSWFLIGSQSVLKTVPPFSFMAYGYMASGLLYGLLFAAGTVPGAHHSGFGFLLGLSPLAWGLTLYMVLFASIGTYSLNNYALQRSAPSVVAVYIFLQPVLAAIFAYFLLGEPFTGNMALAAALTLAGLLLATRARASRAGYPSAHRRMAD